jgi:hypothetical protein
MFAKRRYERAREELQKKIGLLVIENHQLRDAVAFANGRFSYIAKESSDDWAQSYAKEAVAKLALSDLKD